MKPGWVVTIYEDPYSRKKVEGEARLIRRAWRDPDGASEMWAVQFLGAGEPVVLRTIVPEEEVDR
jgi:hypothetical protein